MGTVLFPFPINTHKKCSYEQSDGTFKTNPKYIGGDHCKKCGTITSKVCSLCGTPVCALMVTLKKLVGIANVMTSIVNIGYNVIFFLLFYIVYICRNRSINM